MPKEFKRRDDRNPGGKGKGNDNNRTGKEGREKKGKSDKPAFKRYREDSRPSSFDNDKKDQSKSRSGKPSFAKGRTSARPFDKEKKEYGKKPFIKKKEANPFDIDESDLEYGQPKEEKSAGNKYERKPYQRRDRPRRSSSSGEKKNEDGTVRLNKYISNAGICSRREADDLIASGVVQVNGKVITEMGYKVKPTDVIRYGGQTLRKERLVYLILNKPKDYITTADDPQKRKTVLELIKGACRERVYPVGRLDRATTGLLMFTNDGELTKKLTHPRYGVRKIYHVELDKPLKREDMEKIAAGIELEDGEIKVDEITYVGDGRDKSQVGVEIHSGKNRIVRRIFEQLGYNVRKLDRVMFGSLTKKDLPRGRWRLLTESEVGILKMISSGK